MIFTAEPALEGLQKRSRTQGIGSHVLPGLYAGQRLRPFSSTSSAFNQTAFRRDELEEEEEEDCNPWADLDDSTTDWERAQAKPGPRPAQAATTTSKELPSSGEQTQTQGGMKLSEEEKMWLAAVSAKLERDPGGSEGQGRRQRQRQASPQTLEYSPTPRIVYPPPPASDAMREEPRARSNTPASVVSAAASAQPPRLTHLDASTHQPSMVNISSKPSTLRTATATGKVFLPWSCLDLLSTSSGSGSAGDGIGEVESPAGKGPVFTTARLAGVMAAKRTAEWVPLCHSVPLDGCEILFDLVIPSPSPNSGHSAAAAADSSPASLPYISIRATTTTRSATGVEMEALVAVQAAATTVWDMLKSVAGREMRVGDVMVVRKSGGKSGDWIRGEEDEE